MIAECRDGIQAVNNEAAGIIDALAAAGLVANAVLGDRESEALLRAVAP